MRLIATVFCLVLFVVPAAAHPAWGMVTDSKSNIIFADVFHNNGTIWKLSPEGKLRSLLKNVHAHNVNIDKYGDIYTAHGEKPYRLIKIESGPESRRSLFQTNSEVRFFGGNTAVSNEGVVFFGSRKYIWKYTGGVPLRFSPQRLEWNQAMYLDKDGSIYVPDIGVGNGTVFRLKPDGAVEKIADDLISKLDRPKDKHNDVLLGMAKDDRSNFYITETAGRRVIKIDPKGKVETFYTAEKGWKPTAITFSGDTAFIHEYGRIGELYDFRIMRLGADGDRIELVKHSVVFSKAVAAEMSGW